MVVWEDWSGMQLMKLRAEVGANQRQAFQSPDIWKPINEDLCQPITVYYSFIIISTGNELFSQSDYPYKAYDGACRSKAGKNALKAATIYKYTHVAQGEGPAVAAMAKGAVAVSIEVRIVTFDATISISDHAVLILSQCNP